MTKRATRQERDQRAWTAIHTAKLDPGVPFGLVACRRPCNFKEVMQAVASGADEHTVWSEFLHEFYRYQTASFFEFPPEPTGTPCIYDEPGYQALLAGVAEWLSKKFNLPVPAWVYEPKYFLADWWDSMDWLPGVEEFRDERIARCEKTFLKRKVIFETRSLITL